MQVLSGVLTVFLALVLPVAMWLYASFRQRCAKPVLLGAACFAVFQLLLRMPLVQLLEYRCAPFSILRISSPIVYFFLLALSAGIFEEVGRYFIMSRFMKTAREFGAVAFGMGHGGLEAVLLTGIHATALLCTGSVSSPGTMIAAGAERLFAMMLHIGLSVMVWRAAKHKQKWLLPMAVLIHTAVDFAGAYLAFLGVSVLIVETAVALPAAALLGYAVCQYKTSIKKGGSANEKDN